MYPSRLLCIEHTFEIPCKIILLLILFYFKRFSNIRSEKVLYLAPLLYIHMTNGNLTRFWGIVRELGHLFVIRFIKVGNANFETFCNGF